MSEANRSDRNSRDAVQGLWIGPELSVMEQLSIRSFLMNEHEYHLYVYDDVKNVPAGTILKDANEILPASMIFQYRNRKSYAGFANFFRYKLLLERGGWWADSDLICHRRFDFQQEHVFATEKWHGDEDEVITSGVIRAPAGSEIMAYAWDVCRSKNPDELTWGETGSRLLTEAVEKFSLQEYVKPHQVFCPLPNWKWNDVLNPDIELGLDEVTYAIHLWNEKWRQASQDKNQAYHGDCLYERLKRRFLLS